MFARVPRQDNLCAKGRCAHRRVAKRLTVLPGAGCIVDKVHWAFGIICELGMGVS